MLQCERSPIGHSVDHSDCGTGKSLKAMMLVEADVKTRLKEHLGNPNTSSPLFKPTLILCPPQAVSVWHADFTKFMSQRLRMRIFYRGDVDKSDWAEMMITKADGDESHWVALRRYLSKLDPEDPEVSACPLWTIVYKAWSLTRSIQTRRVGQSLSRPTPRGHRDRSCTSIRLRL